MPRSVHSGAKSTTAVRLKKSLEPVRKAYKQDLGGTFTGQRETLVAILNPHLANRLKSRTSNIKKKLKEANELKCFNPACASNPNEIRSFDTAHPVDKTRPNAIREAIDDVCPIKKDDTNKQLEDCDIAAVLARTKEIHLSMSVTFLCNTCNKNHSKLSIEKIISKPISEWVSRKKN